jgi:SMODS-associating 4TM effector domain
MVNSIPSRQNAPRILNLLRARRRLYQKAKRCQGAVALITLSLPIVGLAVATFLPEARAYVAAAALIFGVCEVIVLDRWNKALLKCAAKLQEEVDCDVLDMRSNEFLVGPWVDPEEVHGLATPDLNDEGERQLRDWYPVDFGRVPIHVGRILCQRENLLYDGNVRKSYGRLLGFGLIALFVGLLTYSIAAHLSVEAFILTVMAPATPAFNWALREFFRQRDTVQTLERLKSESEKLWRQGVDGASGQESAERSRELQDAIYNHRVSSPLVFDFLYRFRRDALESQMKAGAKHLVAEFLKRNPISE